MKLKEFVRRYGEPFSKQLGIDLKSGRSEEIFKWFLASILFAKPIRESSATKTYFCFMKYGITNAKKVLDAGWEKLVEILDEGGYTRYDFSTADKLLEVFGNLQKNYGGDLNKLYQEARNSEDLEEKIKVLGKGIGSTTVSIFLREMRYAWEKADPKPSPLVKVAMEKLNVKDLKEIASKKNIDLVELETALLRYSKDFLKKGKKLKIEI
ncbi:MAG: hypothetical protein HA495_08310 [Thaumarchaeota archaeon]|nr:hypothetical protein [Nitrososphaerota archaeon]